MMATPIEEALILRCTQLHHELHAAGLHGTAHKMHEVVQAVGYEVAYLIAKREREAKKLERAAQRRHKCRTNA